MPKNDHVASIFLRKKVFASFAVLIIFVSVLLSLAFYLEYQHQLRQNVRERLHDIVAITALQVDASAHNTLRKAEQEGNATYLRLQRDLQRIRDATTGIRYVYTMVPGANHEIMFVLDAETNPDEIAHLGELYDDASPLLSKNFSTLNQPLVENDFYTDKWGTWLTGYAPFYTQDGKRAGIVGIDIKATNIITREHHLILTSLPLIFIAILMSLALSWLIGRWLADETTKALKALHLSEEKIRNIVDNSTNLFYSHTTDHVLTYLSPQTRAFFDCDPDEAMKRWTEFATDEPGNKKGFELTLTAIKTGVRQPPYELELAGMKGRRIWVQVNEAPILKDGKTIAMVGALTDITERKRVDSLIEHQATFDALTDLPNRFLALKRLSQLINEAHRDAKQLAILFLDLDDFKKINDTLGHDIGDKLLIEAADRLLSGLRSGDTVGRLGGDEFIILLGGLDDAKDAQPIAENLLNHFRNPFIIDNRSLILTSSIGIAVYPNDGDSPSELLRNADSAMYHSKELGRNTYSYFTEEMNQEVSRRLALEEQMHGALERGEFRVCYQPQVDVNNRLISGTEALLRWNNPILDEVSPEEFIPIAEQTGLIVPIGEFVLTQALDMAAKWQCNREQPFTMAVNLSPRQFREPNLVKFIEQVLEKSGISSENLELEITEGVLMSGHAFIDDALSGLNELGVSLSMDDFGTGYSSLSYLRSYPFNVLKIDRTFINDITIDPADRELVNATIAMAHGLGLNVVAEGVETEEQLAHLASQDCEFAQGYLFSKAVSPERITKMIETE